ncbi:MULTISPECIES: hypothetical protein [unclassified Bradyrhizobium]|uniref:hypothetical protein n=1 Tax=unclassified Bradyrhizobium TaxID=2631580 RepID=UPI0028E9B16D|nr:MULTISPECIES: hypothetical protein [unclassified Bradyrhizobium]
MKLTEDRPYAKPEAAARRLMEIARTVVPVQDGRIHIEKINGPFLLVDGGKPAEYRAGLDLLLARGILEIHESGTYVRILDHSDASLPAL